MENKTSSLKKLSLWQVTIIGIAYMTPMTVFDTFGIVSGITNGHVPLAYLLALGAMLLTAWSYARFSKNSEKSGSAYSYTAESLGPKSGFFVGWCSLLDYLLLPLINVLLAAIYLTALIPSLPYWFWVIVSASLVTLVNCFRIRLLANLSLLFVFAPIILMVIFVYLVIKGIGSTQGYEHVLTLAPLWHEHQSLLPLVAGASVLCFSFLGFDAVTTLSNETKQPTKNIPRAVMLTTLAGGLIFSQPLGLFSFIFQIIYAFNTLQKHYLKLCFTLVVLFPIRILMRANYEHSRLWPCLTCQRFTFTVYNGYR